ncbi:activating signal cointegrator 1 complex subunit 1 [Venturia canescens]|uniref:activating signal cointegrator 1 complex subunit 1 n=1 Tax=Venturia canescens TaxID=32260 RepID=UPI001C9C67C2|nr:activating signal cointegrator 1 complex subunit 1 [Venturia canescens]XP_043274512.1 activating signal cointegrator 1 complex subunit 1 [Venturia canescens]
MDVMEPKLVWVEGRCYRFFESDAWSAKDLASAPYVEDSNPQEFCDLNEDTCPVDIEITPIEGGRYKHSFYVPNVFFRFLIGPNGANRKKLESETKTTIKIPRLGKDGDVVITSSSRTAVLSARHRIDLLVESSRKKLRPTHFLGIPMIDKTIASNYENFKNIVLNDTGKTARGVQEGVFQKPEKMHLTLGMLVLVDDQEVQKAVQALEDCKEQIIKPILEKIKNPIKIKAQGLECMNDDPSDVTVVYGKICSDNDLLQELADKVVNFFVEKDLMKQEKDKVKLHLTVMNSAFLLDHEATHYQRKEKFDATNILKVHTNYYFGELPLNTIQLCKRGEKAKDGYYIVTSKIDLTNKEEQSN